MDNPTSLEKHPSSSSHYPSSSSHLRPSPKPARGFQWSGHGHPPTLSADSLLGLKSVHVERRNSVAVIWDHHPTSSPWGRTWYGPIRTNRTTTSFGSNARRARMLASPIPEGAVPRTLDHHPYDVRHCCAPSTEHKGGTRMGKLSAKMACQ